MNATGLLTLATLRTFFQRPSSHWGIQCVDFDRPVDLHIPVSFNQTYAVPRLVCLSTKRRCYASDGAHAIVSQEAIVASLRVPLRRWPSVDRIPGNGRWPFCFSGGGALYGGANVTASCGADSDCVDVCFRDEDRVTEEAVWCDNATVRKAVVWDDETRDEGWRPWKNGHPRNKSVDVVELDSPVILNRATGTSVIARHGSRWILRRNEEVCLIPVQFTDSSCHVIVHGICYAYDRKVSIRCVDLKPFPPGAVVALIWQPRLTRTAMQPLDPDSTDLFCLEMSGHDPLRFLKCIDRLYPLARKGASSLSPFVLVGRSSTVFIRVAPANQADDGQRLNAVQVGSILISIGLASAIWVTVAVARSRSRSHSHYLEQWVTWVTQELGID